MTNDDFKRFCRSLSKTRPQMAALLGVSEKDLAGYESGSRAIPWYLEQKLYFFLSRSQTGDSAVKPCWEIHNCPNQKKTNCPAWEFQSGAACWLMNATPCHDDSSSPQKKWEACRQCDIITAIAASHSNHTAQKREGESEWNRVSQFEQIIGRDPKMQVVYRLIQDIAVTNTTVMIQGESGTGKELVAHAIHRLSPRNDKPFIVINCSAFPETLLESELFGHEKGAFTGAAKTRAGRFEQADGGTIFLDEIGEISPQAQVKLLRVLQTQKLKRLGGDQILSVDIRVITASNKNLRDLVRERQFRADLYYRLNVVPIFLPALREKPNDIPLLAHHFLQRFAATFAKNIHGFAPPAMRKLMTYDWPGNTRELEHCVEYAVALAKGNRIEMTDLPSSIDESPSFDEEPLDDSLESNEKNHIIRVMRSANWNKKEAAMRLGISRSTLYDKIKRYGITAQTPVAG